MRRVETVRAWEEEIIIPTYLPAAPDKNPMFLEKRVYQGSSGKVYPLPFTDRIAEKPVQRKWRALWLENEFLRVMVLPEIGGRIHVLRDRTNGYDLIYHQPVIKPALVGLAGPWISGGIEFNWPQHHRPATFLPTDCRIEECGDGSKIIWCGDHDPMTRMKGMHGVCLHPGRAYVELKVRVCNRTPWVQTFLWWANVAVRVHEGYQSFFPPEVRFVADHARRSTSGYPCCQGSYYGVNYGERGRKGVPANEVPSRFVPPHCRPGVPALRRGLDLGGWTSSGASPSRIPRYAPNDLSWYANIPTPCSYMCLGSEEDFFGGYDHLAQAGILHVADHHIAPGKKQWTWGNHEFGYAWDRNLTDPDERGQSAPYIELMAGVYTDNQPDFSFLGPGETRTWSQYWYPIQRIGPAHQANLEAAVSLRVGAGKIRMGVCVTSRHPGAVVRLERKNAALEWKADLAPGRPWVVECAQSRRKWSPTDSTLRVFTASGRQIISCRPRFRSKQDPPRPAIEPLDPTGIANLDELYLTGLHLEQYRHATRCPTQYWREALRRDPGDSRCNNAMGLWHLRRGDLLPAERHFRKAIERLTGRNSNPRDGESYYNLGLCLRYQADAAATPGLRGPDFEEVYAAFHKAAWNQAWGAAAYHALAELDCRRGHWAMALEHLNHSLRSDGDHTRARNLKVIVLNKLAGGGARASARREGHGEPRDLRTGLQREAGVLLQETLRLDPLDWWARHLSGESVRCDAQICLDLAHDFAGAGLYAEGIDMLSSWLRAGRPPRLPPARPGGPVGSGQERTQAALPDSGWGAEPLLNYTLGWLHEKLGDAKAALRHYRAGGAATPDYCFPSRLEEIAILEAAMRADPGDSRAPYYLGNLFYDRRRHEEAIQLWERSARLDPEFSIGWRNLGIAYFNVRRQPARARAAYERAFRANPSDARLLYERDQLWKRLGESPARRLRELEGHRTLVRRRDDLSVELCGLYLRTGRSAQALALVSARKFQPWEGGEGQALGQHVRAHIALGRDALRCADAIRQGNRPVQGRVGRARGRLHQRRTGLLRLAAAHFRQALESPPNLGEANHPLANQSEIHYWLGCALGALGDRANARKHWRVAAGFRGDFQAMTVRTYSEMTYYSALSWERLGPRSKARRLLRGLLNHARKLRKAPATIDYFATSLPAMLLFEEDLERRQETEALLLEAQAHLGLGNRLKARSLLTAVLKRDPNHAVAADFARSCAI